jgi:hypothetical protein
MDTRFIKRCESRANSRDSKDENVTDWYTGLR